MVLLVAHRGFKVGVPENTFRAFSLAVARHVDYIELDARLSADGEAFVLHDASLQRTMNANARLAELTAAEVDALNAKLGDSGIPRVTDVLRFIGKARAGGGGVRLMIELKGAGTGAVVAKLVLEEHLEDAVAFSGHDLNELVVAHENAPRVPACLNITSCKEYTRRQLERAPGRASLPMPLAMASIKASMASREYIRACHHLGMLALAWDFERARRPLDVLARMVHDGLDGVLVDDPAMLEPAREVFDEARDVRAGA
ncbi:MAG: glycerophosphodiester phosphodiesterase [Candidatus Lokiarchaeota archaeon]|nr:glycerophosphodiester phosphodiesterase [Candidatus Lokiarchaeota archaeon]